MLTSTVPPPNISRISHHLWLALGVFAVVTAAFIDYVYAEKQIDRAHEIRQLSFLLAKELRQSSDDLTRMVRTYVVTGEPLYKQHYQEILDIRNGKKPRPINYQNIYWDLVMDDDQRPRPFGAPAPLLKQMQQAGFTTTELAKLAEAKANSDELTRTEFAAMALIETANASEANRTKAIQMLHDAAYHQAKASIMRPISEFHQIVDLRTMNMVHTAEAHATQMRIAFILLFVLLVYQLWRIRKNLHLILGSSVNDVHAHIARLGSGDFSNTIPLASGTENSVIAWLAKTQSNLARIDAERSKAEASSYRLTQFYSALSQCNQAIVRSTTEDELFAQICQIVVTFGGMKMAWIGALDEHSGLIRPIACYGSGAKYLEKLRISIDEKEPHGCGPTGTAFREDRPYWCQDFIADPATIPWRESSSTFEFRGSAALPLHRNGQVAMSLTLYTDVVNAFDERTRDLILEMVTDIDFALKNFSREAQRKQAEERIEYLAHFDALTGLPNRTLLNDKAEYVVNLARRHQKPAAVMLLDVDHFKNINDTLGHHIGDQLLIKLAKRLRSTLRDEDVVSRLGGDEFIFLLYDIGAQDAARVAQKLLDAIAEPFQVDAYTLNVTGSIGIALYPNDGEDIEALFKAADSAMYGVKDDGRGGYRFFTNAMQVRSARQLQMVNAMHQSLDCDHFQLHYQPQVSTLDGRIIGAEALLRWRHPELGSVSPLEFIPAAESSGLILPIGEWVLRHAVRQAKQWMQRGFPPLVMAVNLSAVQFRNPDLPKLVMRILDEEGLPPEYLELELTESVAMHDSQSVIAMMTGLHDLGVRMSIDDFGTGYSSLSQLKKFKIYKLKIDQSFVRDISTDPEDKAIVRAIINMAKSLGLITIAEGVETPGQLAFLREEGCDEMQGYLFSKPLPADQFEAFAESKILTASASYA